MNNQVIDIVKFALNVKNYETIPPVWHHGHTRWKICSETGVYFSNKYNTIEYCLGDRYVYLSTDFGMNLIRGSTSDNWHGRTFGVDLKEALNWVKETKYADLGYLLWTGK